MEYVKAPCYSNLDGFRSSEWPELWVSLPRVGDRVESLNRQILMEVVGVEHSTFADGTPYAKVELGTVF